MSEDDIWFGSTARWLVPSTGTCEIFADGLYEHDFSEEALEITVSRAAPLPAPDGGSVPVLVPAMPVVELKVCKHGKHQHQNQCVSHL